MTARVFVSTDRSRATCNKNWIRTLRVTANQPPDRTYNRGKSEAIDSQESLSTGISKYKREVESLPSPGLHSGCAAQGTSGLTTKLARSLRSRSSGSDSCALHRRPQSPRIPPFHSESEVELHCVVCTITVMPNKSSLSACTSPVRRHH